MPKQTCFFPAGTHSSSAVPRLEVLWITLRGRPPDTPSDQLRARALGPTCSFPVLGKQIAWAEGGQGGLVWSPAQHSHPLQLCFQKLPEIAENVSQDPRLPLDSVRSSGWEV